MGTLIPLSAGVTGLVPSATRALHERTALLATSGREVYRLGIGQSPLRMGPKSAIW